MKTIAIKTASLSVASIESVQFHPGKQGRGEVTGEGAVPGTATLTAHLCAKHCMTNHYHRDQYVLIGGYIDTPQISTQPPWQAVSHNCMLCLYHI